MAEPRHFKRLENEREVTIVRTMDGGPLHDLLLEACPPDGRGRKSITILAEALGLSAWGVHKWVRKARIPPARAKQVVGLSEGRVALADFDPYVYTI